jgi:predicted HD superfamily hydrolase involved in NAD metabolism
MPVDYEIAASVARSRLSRQMVEHSERVADLAEEIASAYGLDTSEARIAGVLHDLARELPETELLAIANRLGIEVSDVDRAVPALLHARVGAGIASEQIPGLSASVLRAIESHTCGASEMRPLDMAVYIADSIEPGRTYERASRLREDLGSVSLCDMFADTYAGSVMHLVEGRRPLHPTTIAVWNRYVAGVML